MGVFKWILRASLGASSFLAALCVKGKRERLAPRLQRRHLSHNNATHGRQTYRAQARREQIGVTEFLTLLRLLTKKVFMNGHERVVTRSLMAV